MRPCRSPGCNHHRRTARDAPASKRLAPWVPYHTWKLARLARTPPAVRPAPAQRAVQRSVCRAWPGTRPDCVQYQSDLRGACGPQDGGKLTKNIVPGCHLAPVFFRVPFGVSLNIGCGLERFNQHDYWAHYPDGMRFLEPKDSGGPSFCHSGRRGGRLCLWSPR